MAKDSIPENTKPGTWQERLQTTSPYIQNFQESYQRAKANCPDSEMRYQVLVRESVLIIEEYRQKKESAER